MKQTTYKLFLSQLNKYIEIKSKNERSHRSYVRLLRPHNKKKLNIVGSFQHAINLENHKVDNFNEYSRNSFGIVAFRQFKDFYRSDAELFSIFRSKELFEDFLKNHHHEFVIEDNQLESFFKDDNILLKKISEIDVDIDINQIKIMLQMSLYARCLMACYFVPRFKIEFVDTEQADRLYQLLTSQNDSMIKCNIDTYLSIHGKPQDFTMKAVKEAGFRFHVDSDHIFCTNDLEDYSLEQLYNNFADLYIPDVKAFYSGVIPRVNLIEYIYADVSNISIEKIVLHLGRTSFFTMFGLDNSDIINHPYLGDIKINGLSLHDINVLYDEREASLQDRYHHKIKASNTSFKEELDIINEYLDLSIAAHNLNVSGNLYTSDGYCLYTRRASHDIEDAGNFYCSVNGGCEIFDAAVSFYKNSVPEDMPSITYGMDTIYFGQELTREAIAELGILDHSYNWNYYGVTVMGQACYLEESDKHRMTFHFNVLGEKRCLDKYEDIKSEFGKTPESFENENIYGYNLQCYSSKLNAAHHFIVERIIPWIIENKDTISWFIIFGMACLISKTQKWDAESIISFGFVIASFIMIFHNAIEHIKFRKNIKDILIYYNPNHSLQLDKFLNTLIKKATVKKGVLRHKKKYGRIDNIFTVLFLMRIGDEIEE